MRAEYKTAEKQYEPTIQDPHRMVQCITNPDKLWVQHHNGIFRSTDNADPVVVRLTIKAPPRSAQFKQEAGIQFRSTAFSSELTGKELRT